MRPVEVREEPRAERDDEVRAEVSPPDGACAGMPPLFAASPQVSQSPSMIVPPQFGRAHWSVAGATVAVEVGAAVRAARPQVSQ